MARQQTVRSTELDERYAGYKVYDCDGEKIGKLDELFVDENYQPEYIGVKVGFLGTKATLIPMDIVREDEERRVIEVSQPKSKVKEGPAFGEDEKITPEYEERVRRHYSLGDCKSPAKRGAYDTHYREDSDEGVSSRRARGAYTGGKWQDRKRSDEIGGPGASMGDTETKQFRRHASSEQEGRPRPSSENLADEDEFRVQRSEEELRAGTREREVGGVHVRKQVRTEREQLRVPKRREEVHIDRVPVNREASEVEIGEDEFYVPVIEEEVVVEKRPVAKEEIHLRKEVIEEEEVVESDVRKEEVDIDDRTEHRAVTEHGPDIDNEKRRRGA